MKLRGGFVSNSSSSNFIIAYKIEDMHFPMERLIESGHDNTILNYSRNNLLIYLREELARCEDKYLHTLSFRDDEIQYESKYGKYTFEQYRRDIGNDITHFQYLSYTVRK